jgi:hypothetical protein
MTRVSRPLVAGLSTLGRRFAVNASCLWLALLLGLSSRSALAAQDAVVACLADHVQGQEHRHGGKLLESRAAFKRCSARQCPKQVIRDCMEWLGELQRQVPSVSFRVTSDGVSREDARVFIDDDPVLDRKRGKAVDVNPGTHRVRVVLPPFEPYETALVVNEGDQFRVLDIEFTRARPSKGQPGDAGAQVHRPIPVASIVLAGVSVGAAISGAAFGLSSRSLRQQLEAECAPDCPSDRVAALRRRALLTDISWGVSAASLLTAAAFYVLRPERRVQSSVELDIGWLPAGGAAVRVSFSRF